MATMAKVTTKMTAAEKARIADEKKRISSMLYGLGSGYKQWTIQRRMNKAHEPYYTVCVARIVCPGGWEWSYGNLTESEHQLIQGWYTALGIDAPLKVTLYR